MHLRSGKTFKEMARPTNSGTSASSQSSSQAQSTRASAATMGANVSSAMWATMTVLVTTEMGVTAPATFSTTVAAITQPKIGIYVPPFTTSIPVSTAIPMSPHPQVNARLDDRFIAMQTFVREQPYGMPTSMMENLHNNASIFADLANPFTPYNAHSPSSSSVFGRNAPPALTT